MKFRYVCVDCGKEYVTDKIVYQCPECAAKQQEGEFPRGYLKVIYDTQDLRKLAGKDHVTIYDFFPYEVPNKEVYPVGTTPIIVPKRLNEKLGLKNVFCKMDAYLPSGSFKDRASQLIAAQAIAHNEKRIALASTGNAGAAMSCAGAAYGLDIILFVPETAPINKLMQSVLYGATVVPVKGSYDDAFLLSIEYTRHFGGINRNTAYNPMTIEGKKSVSIELFEQLGRKAPDVVYVPVGDGCIISGVYKGFYDLMQAGLIDRIPYSVCSQSEKSNAISMAFETSEFRSISATTRADSISVDIPASGRMAVQYLKEFGGWCTQVSEEEILDAQMTLVHDSGIFVEPASATAWAAMNKDRDMLRKHFGEDASICVLLTGIGDGFIQTEVDGKSIMFGRADNLRELGIEIPQDITAEDGYEEDVSVMYMIFKGKLVAKMNIVYSLDSDFEYIVKQLAVSGMSICIKTLDPNIDEEMIKSRVKLDEYPMRVIRYSSLEEIANEAEHSDSGVVARGSSKGLLETVTYCEKVLEAKRTNSFICLIQAIIGIVILAVILISGNFSSVRSFYSVLLQLFWLIPMGIVTKALLR